VRHVKELGKKFVKELEEFFVNYHNMEREKYRILDMKGPAEVRRRLEDGIRKMRKKN
jgi:inorganic pyrophosphatase